MLTDENALISTRYGEVLQEEGLELVPLTGYIELLAGGWVAVYADPDLPYTQQAHSLIPQAKVVRIECVPAT